MDKKIQNILEYFKKADPILYPHMTEVDFTKLGKSSKYCDCFGELCADIIGQQLSGKAADTIYGRFKALAGGEVSPEKILKLGDQLLRDCGLSWAKVMYIKDLASKVVDKSLDLDNLKNLTDEEIIKELTKVKGIGNWTAEMFLIFYLGRENVFSFGDLGLRKGLIKIYGNKTKTMAKTESLVKKWGPYKSYATLTLWHVLE